MGNVRRTTRPPGSLESSATAVTGPRTLPEYRACTMPFVLGRSSRAAGCSLATILRPRLRMMVTRLRCSVSVTLPRFATSNSSLRADPARRTRSLRNSSAREIRPAARTTTTTPRRMRTTTRVPRMGRVVSTTSALWSPGRARRGTIEEIVSDAVLPGRSASRRGRTVSHDLALAPGRPGRTILGRPRRSSAKPARCTFTSTRRLPEFVT
jgi:hypothetical protein